MAAAGWRYQRPSTSSSRWPGKDGWRVVAADYVSDDDGSGIVHLAPAFGEDDAQVGRAEDLPVLNPVDADATFDHRVPPVERPLRQGRRPRDHRRPAGRRGLLVAEHPYEHSYPHCWRCGTPLIYWAKTSWFVRTAERRGDLLAQNETHRLVPGPHQARPLRPLARGQHRLGAVPRPLLGHAPAHLALPGLRARHLRRVGGRAVRSWPAATCPTSTCTGPSSTTSPGPAPRPAARARSGAWRRCSTPGSTRAPCRRPSPTTPSATTSASRPRSPPTSSARPSTRRAAGSTRCWRSTPWCSDRRPTATSCASGYIVDEDGQKMSKSQGQRHRPLARLRHLRGRRPALVLLLVGPALGHRGGCSSEGIRESTRQTLLTLWNVFSFFVTYADLDGWRPPSAAAGAPRPTHVLDRWVLGELDATVAEVTEALEGFDALRRRHPPRPASSTTCPTGTCAAAGPGSGRRATPRPTPPCTTAWW